MKNNLKKIFLMFLLLGQVNAGSMRSYQEVYDYVFTLSGGASQVQGGVSQTLTLQPDVQKRYEASGNKQIVASGELFFGMQSLLSPNFVGQLGVTAAGSSDAKFQGNIWEDADPDFNDFTYAYKVSHSHVAIKGKLIAIDFIDVDPYLSVSLGVGFNHAYDYSVTPLLFSQLPAPNFGSQRTTAFTYTLGLGIQKELFPCLQAGVGYEFANWGKNELARAEGQTLGTGILLSHLYTNQIQFSLSFLA